ncbi:cytochrome-c peroxidase [filamentous cyanobacterium LEGE 11480]|uniref:Cytochrome-c peroxidase n=1 Tax=Romeriopsis navalis LEGE 11480 TaxID=2777977 RepID=A0A928VJ73_9CYAN|nr:cytochrome-c peroxidase [Romeriopsis navalis]MBE9028733.1 cytochrome-c peroxidase [Romeriopsis navalis LEGE 11480]
MVRLRGSVFILAICGLLCFGLSSLLSASALDEATSTNVVTTEPIEPIPQTIALNSEKVELGNQLFHDPQLSGNGKVSCASCHKLSLAGADQLPKSIGTGMGFVNAPTVFNSGLNIKQFWDGRADTLETQIDGPMTSDHEMNSNWPDVVNKLTNSAAYKAEFAKLYPNGINPDNIKDAIATFERSLYTPNSRFDQYLRGNQAILTSSEKAGYQKFKDFGCVACHQGAGVGGNMFQKFGVFGDYFKDRGNITKEDLGRYNVTQDEADRYAFKVPSLRNVVLTAPYFHDGSVETVDEAVKVMIKYQLGRPADQTDIDQIVQFLNTLTANVAGDQS